MTTKYIGVDLDGTLAEHNPGDSVETVGAPIKSMVERVKDWLEAGEEVRIITARVANEFGDHVEQTFMIQSWCAEHLGQVLPVQAYKGYGMRELWDDRAVSVIRNTGLRSDEVAVDTTLGKILTWLEKEAQTSEDAARATIQHVQRGVARGLWK